MPSPCLRAACALACWLHATCLNRAHVIPSGPDYSRALTTHSGGPSSKARTTMAPRAALLLLAAALLIAAPAVRASGKRRLAFVEVSVRLGLVGRAAGRLWSDRGEDSTCQPCGPARPHLGGQGWCRGVSWAKCLGRSGGLRAVGAMPLFATWRTPRNATRCRRCSRSVVPCWALVIGCGDRP